MRGNELLYKMELIDPAFIEEAEAAPRRAGSKWRIWGLAAACFLLLVGIFAAVRSGAFSARQTVITGASGPPITLDIANGFHMENNEDLVYHPIDFEDCIRFGLVPKNAVGLDKPLAIAEADLGEFMGTVSGCYDPGMNGCKVYRYARFPEKDAICIVDTPQGYAFYSCRYICFDAAIGGCSDDLLSLYGLPDSLEKMEILSPGNRLLDEISDETLMSSVLALLSAKTNIGLAALERCHAQAWYDVFGNEDVFCDEESGYNRIIDAESLEKAHTLWGKGCRHIRITTVKGFRLLIDYEPAVRSFSAQNGYYMLSEEETEALNAILKITD